MPGANLALKYEGFGRLHGFPGKCVDPATNADADCTADTSWVNAISIPDGSSVTVDGATKWVKAANQEIRLKRETAVTSTSAGITLGVTTDLPTPLVLTGADASDPSDPENAAIYPGAVTASDYEVPPSVIHGELV